MLIEETEISTSQGTILWLVMHRHDYWMAWSKLCQETTKNLGQERSSGQFAPPPRSSVACHPCLLMKPSMNFQAIFYYKSFVFIYSYKYYGHRAAPFISHVIIISPIINFTSLVGRQDEVGAKFVDVEALLPFCVASNRNLLQCCIREVAERVLSKRKPAIEEKATKTSDQNRLNYTDRKSSSVNKHNLLYLTDAKNISNAGN